MTSSRPSRQPVGPSRGAGAADATRSSPAMPQAPRMSSVACSINVSGLRKLKKSANTASAEASRRPSTTRSGTATARPRRAAAVVPPELVPGHGAGQVGGAGQPVHRCVDTTDEGGRHGEVEE